MVALKTIVFCFLFAFVVKSFECAATGSEDEYLTQITQDYYDEIAQAIKSQKLFPKPDLKKKFDTIKSNFADSDDLNADLLHALFETYQEQVFDDQLISQKFNMGKAIDKTKKEIKEGLEKAKNSIVKFGKKAWKEIKHIAKKCMNETMTELKGFPLELKEKFTTCSNEKINNAMAQLAEVMDVNSLPLSSDQAVEQLQKCLDDKDQTVSCITKWLGSISQAANAKVPAKEGEESSTTILEKLMQDIVKCADLNEALEHGKNKVVNTGVSCIAKALLEKLNDSEDTPAVDEAPASEAPASEAPAA